VQYDIIYYISFLPPIIQRMDARKLRENHGVRAFKGDVKADRGISSHLAPYPPMPGRKQQYCFEWTPRLVGP